jgi:hypothetical protein
MSASALSVPNRIRPGFPSRVTPPGVLLGDTVQGLLALSRHSLLAIGVAAAVTAAFVAAKPELRQALEDHALDWLQSREQSRSQALAPAGGLPEVIAATLAEPLGMARATAVDPAELDRQQAAVAQWLSRRYRVAPEPIGRLVQEAWQVGRQTRIEPTLILAVMAIESRFNPFAQSPVGAQGLMQVMTRVHDDKYEAFGGMHAAFDPVSNLRVGVLVLKECISRAGSLEGGLKFYVGAANLPHDGGYAAKVMAEQALLRQVAAGRKVPVTTPLNVPAPVLQAASPAQPLPAPAAAPEPAGLTPAVANEPAAPAHTPAASATVAINSHDQPGPATPAGRGEQVALGEPIL